MMIKQYKTFAFCNEKKKGNLSLHIQIVRFNMSSQRKMLEWTTGFAIS